MKLGKVHKIEPDMATKDPVNVIAVLNGKRVRGTQYSGMAKVTTAEGMAARSECFPDFGRSWVINEMYSSGVPRGSSWMDDYFKYDMNHVNDSWTTNTHRCNGKKLSPRNPPGFGGVPGGSLGVS